jgi:hypothetical protein
MFFLVGYALVAVGIGRIVYQLATGKSLNATWQVSATRAQSPWSYWLGMTLEFLALVFVTSMVVTNGFKDWSKR